MARKNVREATDEARETAEDDADRVVRLPTDVQKTIGDRLREMFDEYVEQGVPDHIAELIEHIAELTKRFDDPNDEGK
jgi:hypothetical protein